MSSLAAVGQQLTADQARHLTEQIKSALTVAYDGLIQAWQGRADLALGYTSWDEYCGREFAEGRMVRVEREQRREIVGQMRQAGMGTPAIASALGISDETARTDLRSKKLEGLPPVRGLDGKTYAHVNRTTGEIEPDDEDDEPALTQEECEALDNPQPEPRRQRPLPDVAKDAGWDLRQAIDRIERVLDDPRFARNADQVTAVIRGHLIDAAERVPSALDRLNTHQRQEGYPQP